MGSLRPLRLRLWIGLLLVAAVLAFVLEKICFAGRVDGLATNVVLLITAVVFLLQWREALETRRILLQEHRAKERPKVALQLTQKMDSAQRTQYAIVNQGTHNVEARVFFSLSWLKNDREVESFGTGLLGGERPWIVHFGQMQTGNFTLLNLANNPRGEEPGEVVSTLQDRRGVKLNLRVKISTRNIGEPESSWVDMPHYHWVLPPGHRVWVADHELREADETE